LDAIPAGTLRIKKPPDYDLDIFEGDKRIGKAGESLTLTEGKYSLTFKNDKVFVKETAQVTVEGGKESQPVITFPALGTLTVLAPALAVLLCTTGASAAAAAQPDDDRPLDARTFTQGIDAVKQGKRDEGIRILRKLSQDFPDSPFASQALLKAADLIYPVAAW